MRDRVAVACAAVGARGATVEPSYECLPNEMIIINTKLFTIQQSIKLLIPKVDHLNTKPAVPKFLCLTYFQK